MGSSLLFSSVHPLHSHTHHHPLSPSFVMTPPFHVLVLTLSVVYAGSLPSSPPPSPSPPLFVPHRAPKMRQFTEAQVSGQTDLTLLSQELDSLNQVVDPEKAALKRSKRQSQWTLLDPRTGRPVGPPPAPVGFGFGSQGRRRATYHNPYLDESGRPRYLYHKRYPT